LAMLSSKNGRYALTLPNVTAPKAVDAAALTSSKGEPSAAVNAGCTSGFPERSMSRPISPSVSKESRTRTSVPFSAVSYRPQKQFKVWTADTLPPNTNFQNGTDCPKHLQKFQYKNGFHSKSRSADQCLSQKYLFKA
jgi:hypothetical protein